MNFTATTLPVLSPNPRRSSHTRSRCRAVLEKRRQRAATLVGLWALGSVGATYFIATILDALRLYSSR